MIKDIESYVAGRLPHQKEQVCGDYRQGFFQKGSSDLPENEGWLQPGMPGITIGHGDRGHHTLLEITDQDGFPD